MMGTHAASEIVSQFAEVLHWRHGNRPALAYRQALHPHGSHGSEKKVLILLLHGLADSGACFTRLLGYLPKKWIYVALDWRGMGHSEWLPEGFSGYSSADHVVDLVLFANKLRKEHAPDYFFVVAHSMGGVLAMNAVALGGLQLDGLIMLESIGAGMPPELFSNSEGRRIDHAISVGLQPRLRRSFPSWEAAFEWTASRHLGDTSPGGRGADDVSAVVLTCISEMGPDGEINILADPRLHAKDDAFFYLPREFERQRVFRNLRCPVLFLIAEDGPCMEKVLDRRGMPSLKDRLEDLNAPKLVKTVPSGGHYPHIDLRTVEMVASHMVQFIRQCFTPNELSKL